MNVNRRIFLKQGALAFVCLGAGPMWGPNFLRNTAFAADLGSRRDNKILICIFQRGAVDGLSMVVPYGDPRDTQYRKNAGRWQFFAVARREDGKPNPERIIIARKSVNWQSPGAKFYLDWTDPESGKRTREIAAVAPREARDA